MDSIPQFDTTEEADETLPDCLVKCSVCGPGKGHHWYLDFSDSPGDSDDHQNVQCKHCTARAAIQIDAEDMPEI